MKVLIIRFSSIGDIVLTTPVIRILKTQFGAELHYLTKKKFKSILQHNPYLDRIHSYEDNSKDLLSRLKLENFDLVIDLHNNLRSLGFKLALRRPSKSFFKANLEKWLMVNFKLDRLPKTHIVERYLSTLDPMIYENDGMGLDFFYPRQADLIKEYSIEKPYVSISIGAAHHTKQIPSLKIENIIDGLPYPVVLLGGEDVAEKGRKLSFGKNNVINTCGRINLLESAQLIDDSICLLTGDTGLMHIGAALKKPMVSIWGSTIPSFGMYPYYGSSNIAHEMVETKINCRPCSKTGFNKCPKGHFDCMNKIDVQLILSKVNEILNHKINS